MLLLIWVVCLQEGIVYKKNIMSGGPSYFLKNMLIMLQRSTIILDGVLINKANMEGWPFSD
jgi:hypothetical protein